MEEEASKFGIHVSWPKTKIQSLGSGHGAKLTDINVNGHTVGAVDDFIYLGSMQSCHSNSRPECLRRLGITATVMQRPLFHLNFMGVPLRLDCRCCGPEERRL